MVKLIKNTLKKLYVKIQEHSPYRFAEFLDTPQENMEIDKARKEIREMLQYCFFPIIAMIFLIIYVGGMDLSKKEGSGFIMFAFIIIFIVWAFVIVHTNKKNIPHLNQHPKETN